VALTNPPAGSPVLARTASAAGRPVRREAAAGGGLLKFLPVGPGTGSGGLLLLVVVLFGLNVFLHYPGTMSNDSSYQYEEVLSGRYTDWHPPIMVWLWSLLRHIADGPSPLLVLHLFLYWTGFGLLADALRRTGHPGVALLMVFAGAFPPFILLNANVIKDVGMVATWLAAFGLLYWFRSQRRPVPIWAGLLMAALVAYGLLVRSNAVFAVGPLLLYALAPASWLRPVRLIAGAVLIALVAVPATQVLNRWLFNPTPMNPAHSLFLFDLVGIAKVEQDPSLVAPRATLSVADLNNCYTPYWWDSFSPWGRCSDLVNRADGGRAGVAEGYPTQWLKTIAAHPLAYAQHRLKHFNSSVLFAVPLKHSRLAPEFRNDDPAYEPIEVTTERDVKRDLLRKNPFVWPVTWLVWGIFLLIFASRSAPDPGNVFVRALLVSALAYSGAYLVIGVATDLRYHYWTLAAVLIATILMLPQVADGLRRRSTPLLAGLAAVALIIAIGLATRLLDFQAFAV
jgi:hypothetical protein